MAGKSANHSDVLELKLLSQETLSVQKAHFSKAFLDKSSGVPSSEEERQESTKGREHIRMECIAYRSPAKAVVAQVLEYNQEPTQKRALISKHMTYLVLSRNKLAASY